jgi:2-methylcitrate dehydratase PrpD
VDPGIGLKKWACYNGSQRAMDGVLRLREKLRLTPATLERLDCRMPPGGMQVLIYPVPKTGLEAKFSLPYSLAAGVLDGGYSLATFSDAAVMRTEIQPLLGRIHVTEDARCGAGDPLLEERAAGARGFVEVEAHTTDGRRECVRVDAAPGHPSRELGWDELFQKFMDCAKHGGLEAGRARAAYAALRELDACAHVNEVVELLAV